MTDSRSMSQEMQEQILETVRKSQDAVVDAVKSWADTIQKITPQLPAPNEITEKLPKPTDLVDDAYNFAEQLLTAQREFAHKVLEAAAPVVEAAKNQPKQQ